MALRVQPLRHALRLETTSGGDIKHVEIAHARRCFGYRCIHDLLHPDFELTSEKLDKTAGGGTHMLFRALRCRRSHLDS